MAYIYQADLWCDDCGSKICERLIKSGQAHEIIPWNELLTDSQTTESNVRQIKRCRILGETGLYCEDDWTWLWKHFQLDPQYNRCDLDESDYDSDDYPKYASDPGKSDSPHHCAAGEDCENAERLDYDGCAKQTVGMLLTETLTSEGIEWIYEDIRSSTRRSPVVLFWFEQIDGLSWPTDLYEIKLDSSDDDPTRITAIVQGPYADEWCDAHGSLDGGTWECSDGPEFCYDILMDRPGLTSELESEGYDLDLSEYWECGEDEWKIASHASECSECEYDYRKGEDHLEQMEGEQLHFGRSLTHGSPIRKTTREPITSFSLSRGRHEICKADPSEVTP